MSTDFQSPATKRAARARVIAFYLPQFHPIPDNNNFWGNGFTEWTNVTKARPLFKDHLQPHYPKDLGFYDLRVPEVRQQQASLAQNAGIEGFCYWHYWFGNGKRVLERVFAEVVGSGQPDFPFCLGWANESWTGRWHGLDKKVLIQQSYPGPEDEREHFYAMLPAFKDKRYMEVNGRKLFILYRPELIPSVHDFTSHWNCLAQKSGFEGFYFISADKDLDLELSSNISGVIPRHIHKIIHSCQRYTSRNIMYSVLSCFGLGQGPESLSGKISGRYPIRTSYESFASCWNQATIDEKVFPCIFPNWDNTPRSRMSGYVLQSSSPSIFANMARKAITVVSHRPFEERLVFLKSWNEWAEGNYMEPDFEYDQGYLSALAAEVYDQSCQLD